MHIFPNIFHLDNNNNQFSKDIYKIEMIYKLPNNNFLKVC